LETPGRLTWRFLSSEEKNVTRSCSMNHEAKTIVLRNGVAFYLFASIKTFFFRDTLSNPIVCSPLSLELQKPLGMKGFGEFNVRPRGIRLTRIYNAEFKKVKTMCDLNHIPSGKHALLSECATLSGLIVTGFLR
jgi:hypothetical protein